MAHFMNFKKGDCGLVLSHIERKDNKNNRIRDYSNENIDKDRTHLNYSLLQYEGSAYQRFTNRLNELKGKKEFRKDANLLVGLVITTPLDNDNNVILNEEQERLFFEKCYEFVSNKFGTENIITSSIHRDEIHSHIHISFIPQGKNKEGELCVSCKQVVNKKMLETFHKDLQLYLDNELDFECPILKAPGENKQYCSVQELKAKSKLKEIEENTNEEIKSIQDFYNKKCDDVEKQVNNKIIYLQDKIDKVHNQYEKGKERYNNMCVLFNNKKQEYDKILSSNKDSSIIADFRNMGQSTFLGKGKIYNENEVNALLEKVKVIEGKYEYYKNNQNLVEQLNKQHQMQLQHFQNKIESLKDNIDTLQEQNVKLKLYENYVNDNNKIIDFNNYASNYKIEQVERFSYDMKSNTTQIHKEPAIVSINDYKSKKQYDKQLANDKENEPIYWEL